MSTIVTLKVPLVHTRRLSWPWIQISYGACPVRNNAYRSYSGSCLSLLLSQRSHLGSSPSPRVSETKRAYIALDDQTNLEFLGAGLHNLGYTIFSTGETASVLDSAGVPVTEPEERTKIPDTLDTHVKKLDQELKHQNGEHSSGPYVVVVNCKRPPFVEASCDSRALTSRISRIARASNKDYLVVVDPQDYCSVLTYLEQKLQDEKFRNILALKRFHHVLTFFSSKGIMSSESTIPFTHGGGMAKSVQHHGKEMSFQNYLEADFAWNCVTDFFDPTCVVMKGRNPCGIVSRDDICEAHKLAVQSDSLSAYGGILTFNVEVDEVLAVQILELRNPKNGGEMVYEIVIAPGYSQKGLEILCGKSKNLRVLEAVKNKRGEFYFQHVTGGWLPIDNNQFRIVSNKSPTKMELDDLKFAWVCAKHGERDAVVLAKNKCMLSWGPEQSNYLESLQTAMIKAGKEATGAVLASGAVFTSAWKDVVKEACENGVTAIVDSGIGNSRKDEDVIDLCNQYGVSLLYTRDD